MKKGIGWVYLGIILVIILVIVLLTNKSASNNTIPQNNSNNGNVSTGVIAINNSLIPQNNPSPKTNYSAYYPTNWQKSYLDLPSDLVFIYVPGSYNQINISSETQVSEVTISGAHNNVTFCNNTYPAPMVDNVGVYNQVGYITC